MTRRESLIMAGGLVVGMVTGSAQAVEPAAEKLPPRMPLDEFVQDADLMKALIRGVRAMKARKPSDPLSWFFQAAIHGVTDVMVTVTAATDPGVSSVDKAKYWNQCPHAGQSSANFLPWHRAYTYYFERILRAHTGEPRFALPYWDYSKPENYRFPREFGTTRLAVPVDGDDNNPLWHDDRNLYFASWEHWSGNNLPYSQLTPEAVDWAPARDSTVFFGMSEAEGLGGSVGDDDPSTRGRLESFPHDPIHRLTGVIIPDQYIPNPADPVHPTFIPSSGIGMSSPPTAGFDPIFCIHHSNIDRLWAEWSLMPGKDWGNFPSQTWFDEAPWYFFDVALDNSVLKPKEVNQKRKAYFDYRALGISFRHEDFSKTPLALPDPIPSAPSPSPVSPPVLLATIATPGRVSGLLPERVATTATGNRLAAPFAAAKAIRVDAQQKKRILMRISGVSLGALNVTGFDVHLVKTTKGTPKRTDPSFVGSVALFRHEGHSHSTSGHAAHAEPKHNPATIIGPSDTFDVTNAVRVAGDVDPAKMHVVIVPYSLSATVTGNKAIVEANALSFKSVEFFSKD